MPWIDPLNSIPEIPRISVTSADRMRTKSPGSFSMSSHWIPISVIRIGMKDGNLKASPVAEPTPRTRPNPGRASKLPSPRIWKFRASPESSTLPILTVAPTERNSTTASSSAAPVFSTNPTVRRVTKVPRFSSRVSTSKRKDSTRPCSNPKVARRASSSC